MSEPRLKRDWVGRYVKLRRDLETQGGVIFDAGEVMQVYKTYHGRMGLRALHRCEHCERRALSQITGVETYNLEILPEDYEPPEVEPLAVELERLREQLTALQTRNGRLEEALALMVTDDDRREREHTQAWDWEERYDRAQAEVERLQHRTAMLETVAEAALGLLAELRWQHNTEAETLGQRRAYIELHRALAGAEQGATGGEVRNGRSA